VNSSTIGIQDLLRRYQIRPNKSLGQNFLVDRSALEQVVAAAAIQVDDLVMEVGPGLGHLTRLLAERAQWVVAVELDEGLIPALDEILAPFSNVTIVQGDILGFDPSALLAQVNPKPSPKYLVVANIPYYITSALLRHLLETSSTPDRLVLTVQCEVAERICASEGKMSLLSLSVQVYGSAHITARIPAGSFYPPPKVDSAVVRVDLYPEPRIPQNLLPHFFRLAKAGFSQKRKNLRNALSGGMRWSPQQAENLLDIAGIDPRRRAQTLSLQEWDILTRLTITQPPSS